MLPKFLNASHSKSINQSFRRKRFELLKEMIGTTEKRIRILDIGGTFTYWQNMGFDPGKVKITLLNLEKEHVNHPSFESVIGDATDLSQYSDESFDIVFSNSVIEHLYTKENQIKMAKEIKRVGVSYFVQTPNKYFPIEPHWLFPFFQFLPTSVKVFMTKNFNLGNYKKTKDTEKAKRRVEEVRLLSLKEFVYLFEDAIIWKEKFLFITKSIVAIKNNIKN